MTVVGSILELLDVAGVPYKQIGNSYLGVCPVCGGGHRTPCCSYSPEKNVWHCFSCGEGGGIKKLKEVLNVNVSLKNFIARVKTYVYKPSDITNEIKPYVYRKPDRESIEYLKNRGIDYQKVKRFIRFMTSKKKWHYTNGFRLLIPSFDKEGRTRNVKIRNVFPEEKRKELGIEMKVISWKGGENYMIGMNWLPENADFVLIVEGEMDFLTVKSIDPDFPVIALPSANYRFKDELNCLPKKVFLLLDNDEAGEVHSFRLEQELKDKGFEVKVSRYPEKIKDFNELLQKDSKSAEKLLQIQGGKI